MENAGQNPDRRNGAYTPVITLERTHAVNASARIAARVQPVL